MPYYAGDYYTGDYYRGDFLGLGKAFKSVTKFVGGLGIPVVSQVANIANRVAGGGTSSNMAISSTPQPLYLPTFGGQQQLLPGGATIKPEPGVSGFVHRLAPGGYSGYVIGRRKRMNVTNVKALRRAGRRVRGFLKLARRMGALPVSSHGKKLFAKKRTRR